jgi:two-component system LytT family response regulator
MATPVKHLYMAPVNVETNLLKYGLQSGYTAKPPVVRMENSITPKDNDFKLILSTGNGVYYFSPQEIIRLEAKNNCTKFFFSSHNSLLICKTLKEYDAILRKYGFLRIHKSYLVNKNFIICCTNTGTAILKDNSSISISRRRKKEIMDLLKG